VRYRHKKFTFAISSADEFLLVSVTVDYCEQRSVSLSNLVRPVCVRLNPAVMHFSQCQ